MRIILPSTGNTSRDLQSSHIPVPRTSHVLSTHPSPVLLVEGNQYIRPMLIRPLLALSRLPSGSPTLTAPFTSRSTTTTRDDGHLHSFYACVHGRAHLLRPDSHLVHPRLDPMGHAHRASHTLLLLVRALPVLPIARCHSPHWFRYQRDSSVMKGMVCLVSLPSDVTGLTNALAPRSPPFGIFV